MEEVQFSLNVEEYNYILKTLSEKPYKEVSILINKLNNQVSEYVNKNNKQQSDEKNR